VRLPLNLIRQATRERDLEDSFEGTFSFAIVHVAGNMERDERVLYVNDGSTSPPATSVESGRHRYHVRELRLRAEVHLT
jgi:hypothetical protein